MTGNVQYQLLSTACSHSLSTIFKKDQLYIGLHLANPFNALERWEIYSKLKYCQVVTLFNIDKMDAKK